MGKPQMNAQLSSHALTTGHELHWYRIERVLGQGAFGITYLAHDINLDRHVAIKEYLPSQFSSRKGDMTVTPISDAQKEDFEWGLKRFISEARTLTKFEHHNLVKVLNVFEMNNTAYMVMNYEVGKSLNQLLKIRKILSESEITKILLPLMSGLELMHAKGFLHRDIKPGNIFIRDDGSPVLLDFGSARQLRSTPGTGNSEEQQTLTSLISPGYAPIEQYGSRGDRQGPWTDIYGLGATLYRAVTGLIPAAAVDRGEAIMHDMGDPFLGISEAYKDRYSRKFLKALDHAMAFKAQDRPQSIVDWRREFGFSDNETAAAASLTGSQSGASASETPEPSAAETMIDLPVQGQGNDEPIDTEAETVAQRHKGKPGRVYGSRKILVAGAVTVMVLLAATLFMVRNKEEPATDVTTPEVLAQSPMSAPDKLPAAENTAQETPAVTETAVAGDQAGQKQIQELLTQAQEDIKALRLTGPRDNNAFDKYMKVLDLDQANVDAIAGMRTITDTYVAMANKAIESNNLDRADAYLKKAAAITPGSLNVAKAQEALQAKRAEQTSAGEQVQEPQASNTQPTASTGPEEATNDSFWDKIKKWDQENVEKSKQAPKKTGPTVDDYVHKAFDK
jgi:serine/threonine protein kinase